VALDFLTQQKRRKRREAHLHTYTHEQQRTTTMTMARNPVFERLKRDRDADADGANAFGNGDAFARAFGSLRIAEEQTQQLAEGDAPETRAEGTAPPRRKKQHIEQFIQEMADLTLDLADTTDRHHSTEQRQRRRKRTDEEEEEEEEEEEDDIRRPVRKIVARIPLPSLTEQIRQATPTVIRLIEAATTPPPPPTPPPSPPPPLLEEDLNKALVLYRSPADIVLGHRKRVIVPVDGPSTATSDDQPTPFTLEEDEEGDDDDDQEKGGRPANMEDMQTD
jgi:hypothetical protein